VTAVVMETTDPNLGVGVRCYARHNSYLFSIITEILRSSDSYCSEFRDYASESSTTEPGV